MSLQDGIVVALVLGALALAAAMTPSVRRWFADGRTEPLVDPSQDITVESIDGLPGWYHYRFRNRVLPRGRRHASPPDATVHRRDDPRERTR
ncbi:MAG TPA: hypothetical protein VHU77_11280 [Candidatus Limnocylindria bacterium]|jgi:hypothetical protein|nr:hypothetical protein [Candidatus Limnocylindria bacterium]